MKRNIKQVIVHCSASGPTTTVNDIRQWHTARGFVGPDGVRGTHDDIGYHYVIEHDGTVADGRPENKVGAHCRGQNTYSIGICLVGGTDGKGKRHEFSKAQFDSLAGLLKSLIREYGDLVIKPHNFYAKKLCPDFSVADFLTKYGIQG